MPRRAPASLGETNNGERTTDNAAQLATLAAPSQITPPCPHFGACGGCQLQHLVYSAQLDRKAERLRQFLSAFTLPELQLHPSPPLAYRNRIRLTLREIDGRLRAGYLSRSATKAGAPHLAEMWDEEPHNAGAPSKLRLGGIEPQMLDEMVFVPITQCPIATPLLWRAAEAFLTAANNAAWLRNADLTPDQLELFTTADESKLQLTLYLRTAHKNLSVKLAADFNTLCESLHTQVSELAGAGIAFLPLATHSRRIEHPRPGPTWGSPGLSYTIPPLSYWVPRGAFFQVNRFLIPELVTLVSRTAAASPGKSLAWDLYAGVGLFSRALTRTFAGVTAVEIAEPAATALAQTKMPNLHAVKATTLDFLRAAVLQRDRPSLTLLDPPRAGLGKEVCSLLVRITAPTLVYVSCSPQALARDLADLTDYTIAELHLFDLFPQTSHIETVTILTRN